MKLEQVPATGREKKDHLSPPLKVLSEFYEALNSKDLEKMEKNWAQTDESVMDNLWVESSEDGRKLNPCMNVSSAHLLSTISSFMTIAIMKQTRYFL